MIEILVNINALNQNAPLCKVKKIRENKLCNVIYTFLQLSWCAI